eukprot:g31708.t1
MWPHALDRVRKASYFAGRKRANWLICLPVLLVLALVRQCVWLDANTFTPGSFQGRSHQAARQPQKDVGGVEFDAHGLPNLISCFING